jgi:transposase
MATPDNLSVHTGARVRQMIEARGSQVLFLPAYLPDFTPIEEAKSCAESMAAPDAKHAPAKHWWKLSPRPWSGSRLRQAHGWFWYCGYLPHKPDK